MTQIPQLTKKSAYYVLLKSSVSFALPMSGTIGTHKEKLCVKAITFLLPQMKI